MSALPIAFLIISSFLPPAPPPPPPPSSLYYGPHGDTVQPMPHSTPSSGDGATDATES